MHSIKTYNIRYISCNPTSVVILFLKLSNVIEMKTEIVMMNLCATCLLTDLLK